MDPSITATVVSALPDDGSSLGSNIDLSELREDLEQVAMEALDARMRGIDLVRAVRDPDGHFPNLTAFHSGLRDALLVEIPKELQPWVSAIGGEAVRERLPARSVRASALAEQHDALSGRLADLGENLFSHAYGGDPASAGSGSAQLQAALSELLLFESVRLRLLVTAWSSTDFETLGGDEETIDEIAWTEVEAMLQEPALTDASIRALPVMLAAGNVALARDAAERMEALRLVGEEERETLRMRARLRSALRELRLPESVLLENALSGLLGEERIEIMDLQAQRPIALDGLSRQAMDQRVSRGRRALRDGPESWPSRRRPALFDLLRSDSTVAE